jgi:hypothetical protein
LTIAAAVGQLRLQGRMWHCVCGQWLFWVGDAWGKHTSQHLFDPYSFTHALHGFLLCWLLAWLLPKLSAGWALWMAVFIEASWEIFENTNFVIDRYRANTASVEYSGDSVINSLGDIVACGLGFVLAWKIGFRRSLALFVLIEIALLVWIRDSLILTVIMLAWPMEALKQWQAGH